MLTLCRQVHMGFWCPHLFVFTYESKAPSIGKEEVQLSLFTDSMVIYVGYLMEFTKKATKINQQVYQGCKM